MATSPTILTSPPNSLPSDASNSVKTKTPFGMLLLAALAGVLLTAAVASAIGYYLARTGKLSPQTGAPRPAQIIQPATHVMVLEPMLVNLADMGGSSYLRVALALRIADTVEGKGAGAKGEDKERKADDASAAAVRDTILTVLGQQTADDLLAVDGKEHLKTALKTGLLQHNTDLKVVDVFFTDFLVQR
jgi:flagellar FliL protein